MRAHNSFQCYYHRLQLVLKKALPVYLGAQSILCVTNLTADGPAFPVCQVYLGLQPWLEQYFDIISFLYIVFTVSNQSDRLANCHGFAGVYFLCHYPYWDINLHRLG